MSRYSDDYSQYSDYTDVSEGPRSVGSRSTCSMSTRASGTSETTATTATSYLTRNTNNESAKKTHGWADGFWAWYWNDDKEEVVDEGGEEDDCDDDYSVDTADATRTRSRLQPKDCRGSIDDRLFRSKAEKRRFLAYQKREKKSIHAEDEFDDLSQASLESDGVAQIYSSPNRREHSGHSSFDNEPERARADVTREEREDQSHGEQNHAVPARQKKRPPRQQSGGRNPRELPPRPPKTRVGRPSSSIKDRNGISHPRITDDEINQKEPQTEVKKLLRRTTSQEALDNVEAEPDSSNEIPINATMSSLHSLGARKRFPSPLFRRAASFDGVLRHHPNPKARFIKETKDSNPKECFIKETKDSNPKESCIEETKDSKAASEDEASHVSSHSQNIRNGQDCEVTTPTAVDKPRSKTFSGSLAVFHSLPPSDIRQHKHAVSRPLRHPPDLFHTMSVDRYSREKYFEQQDDDADSVVSSISRLIGRIREANGVDQDGVDEASIISMDRDKESAHDIPWE